MPQEKRALYLRAGIEDAITKIKTDASGIEDWEGAHRAKAKCIAILQGVLNEDMPLRPAAQVRKDIDAYHEKWGKAAQWDKIGRIGGIKPTDDDRKRFDVLIAELSAAEARETR